MPEFFCGEVDILQVNYSIYFVSFVEWTIFSSLKYVFFEFEVKSQRSCCIQIQIYFKGIFMCREQVCNIRLKH